MASPGLISAVNVQLTSDVDFCRQIFRVLKLDASMPVDRRVFMKQRALCKSLPDSGVTDMGTPGNRQYTLRHGKVVVEAMAAGIVPPEFAAWWKGR